MMLFSFLTGTILLTYSFIAIKKAAQTSNLICATFNNLFYYFFIKEIIYPIIAPTNAGTIHPKPMSYRGKILE